MKNQINRNEMPIEDKKLLLGVLLYDIRLNWSDEISGRLNTALCLSSELELNELSEKIHGLLLKELKGDNKHFDGRVFRGDYEQFLEDVNISDRSELFTSQAVYYLTYPEMIFEDWERFANENSAFIDKIQDVR
ncbi:hypothetical protein ACR301_20720 [Bacillus subtilis]|uniref:hypothetical protein n=1 Tax=Bacillus TaxID=1386 RepID=UPI0004E45B81|nr:hypothetical protein [Bacillus]WIT27102.1 hypothetical protein [Bacillus phage SPbetaL2]KAA0936929.1 hypothetical protein FQ086_04945 [Bacillus sp. ANT_WA51]KFC32311.1 hypothetical protein ZQL_05070 [Bacillus subtilis]MBE0186494.1 hypothetical protein [Bacillus subtilis]MCZ8477137.1 hypothetical protein [Bacillus subtilis]